MKIWAAPIAIVYSPVLPHRLVIVISSYVITLLGMDHLVIDQRKLEIGRLVSNKLTQNPKLLCIVKDHVSKQLSNPLLSESVKENYREWDKIVQRGPESVIRVLTSETDESCRLRQSSPCNCLMTQPERNRILSKYGSIRA